MIRRAARAASAATAFLLLAAGPAAAASITTSVRMEAAVVRSCAGARAACVIPDVRGRAIELRSTVVGELADAPVALDVAWRAPGARRFEPARVVTTRLDAAGAARVALRRVALRPGTWCVKPRLVEGTAGVLAAASPTCVRLRPAIEIGWAGDIVVGSSYGLPPSGGRTQFEAVDHLLRRPDLMIGNYEGTLSRGGTPRCAGGALCYIFQAPPERARNLARAGFDVLNLANNHGLDMGAGARRESVVALRGAGLDAAGLPGQVLVRTVHDTRVAIVGMSPYPGTTNMRSPAAVRDLVRAARRRADVVVVAMHVGLEGPAGAHVPRGADYGTHTRAAAHGAIEAGADVVFGSGPHVVRGVERWRGRYVVYSSGNFAGWRNFGLSRLTSQSGVVRMRFDHRGRPTAAAWDGVVLRGPGIPHPDRSGAVVRRVAELSRADFGRRGARFSRSGSFR